MSNVSELEIRSFLVERLRSNLDGKGLQPENVNDSLDLVTEGIIDSLGLLELISAVEAEFELQVDFEQMNTEDLTVLGPFCRYVARFSNGDSPQGHP